MARLYTKNGEWIEEFGPVYRVGLAESSAADLGDVTFVEAPTVGRVVGPGETVCTLEAVKAAADFYSPSGGRVAGVNPRLAAEPQLVSESPEGEGWLFSLDQLPAGALEGLLDEAAWKAWEGGR